MRQTPRNVDSATFQFIQQHNSIRNLRIVEKHSQQVFDIERADAPELASALEEIVKGIRESYGITE